MKFDQTDFIPAVGARIVEYLGIYVILPAYCKYIATDANGDVYAFMYEPDTYTTDDMWYTSDTLHFLGNFKFPVESWKETLRSYPDENN